MCPPHVASSYPRSDNFLLIGVLHWNEFQSTGIKYGDQFCTLVTTTGTELHQELQHIHRYGANIDANLIPITEGRRHRPIQVCKNESQYSFMF